VLVLPRGATEAEATEGAAAVAAHVS
jgi:hypothetical protein